MLIEKKAKQTGVCAVVVTSTSAKHYNNKLYLSSSSATQILDSIDIPAINALKKDTGSVGSSKASLGAHISEPKDGTIENLLMWARNRKNDSATFLCKARIDDVRTRKGWNFPSCGGDDCKKGATRKGGHLWCDSCERPVEYPVISYRLVLGISDDTERTVVVLFDEPSVELIKFPASALFTDDEESFDDHANLPSPILDLIGTTHLFEIKSHTYYEYGTFESFTCWVVDSPHPSIETGSSSTVDNETVGAVASSKPSTPAPSIVTPSKPKEDKNKNRVDPEDSEGDDELMPTTDGQDFETINAIKKTTATSASSFKRADIEHSEEDIVLISVDGDQDGEDDTPTDRKKTRRFVVEDSE